MPGNEPVRQSTSGNRRRADSDESDRPVGNFGGNLNQNNIDTVIIPRDSEIMDSMHDPSFARGGSSISSTLQQRDPVQYHKQHLKALSDFYSEILNKQN